MGPRPSDLANDQPSNFSDAFSPADSLCDVSAADGTTVEEPVPPRSAAPLTQPEAKAGKERRPLPSIPGYELLEELGRGGMGVVYKARHLGLNRLVALKMILAAEMASPDALERFHAEALALAQLHHPNIVQVYDVGTVEDKSGTQRPYMALELVDGGSLSRQLRGRLLSPWEAAELLETLARAMHAAHEKGILHRDLKPGNILLSDAPSGTWASEKPASSIKPWASLSTPTPRHSAVAPAHQSPTPKITDFGLAKRLEGDPNRTRTGEVVGTPNYMAPEQAAGLGQPLGPAVDIYALGAILYELLTGRPPFQGVSPMDTVLQVLSRDPLPPSVLQHTLPQDIETICLKCLRREPHQRYATAADLADDLRRFQQAEPILARPVGRLEWTWRWCRRNPVVAVLIAAVMLLLVGGILVSSHFAVQEAEQARQARKAEAVARALQQLAEENAARARENEKRAKEEELRARLVSQFLTGIFQDSDPLAVSGRLFGAIPERSDTLLVREALDRGRRELGSRLKDEPLLRALLLDKIGTAYLGLGDVDQAEKLLSEALTLRRQYLPHDHPDLADSLLSMGFLRFLRHTNTAIPFFREALAIRQTHFGPDDPRTAEAMIYLAMPLVRDTYHEEGERLLRRALAIRRKQPGDQRREIAVPLLILTYSLLKRGAAFQAAPHVLELMRLGEVIERQGIGILLQKGIQAKLAETFNRGAAVALWRDAIAEAASVLGPDHFVLTFMRSELSVLLENQNDGPALEREMRDSLPQLRKFYDTRSHMVGNGLKKLGHSLLMQHKPAEAIPPLDEAIAILRTLPDTDGLWRLSQALDLRGHAAYHLGQLAAARQYWSEELSVRIELYRHHQHKTDVIQHVSHKLEDAAFFAEDVPLRWRVLEETLPWFDPERKRLPFPVMQALVIQAEALEAIGQPAIGAALRQASHYHWRQWLRVLPRNETLRHTLPKLYAQAAARQARPGLAAEGPTELMEQFRRLMDTHRYSHGPDFAALYPVQLVEHACILAVGSAVLAEHAAAFPPKLLACRQPWEKRALQLLREAVQAGYRNTSRLRTDPDLASLRGLPEFEQLLRELEAAAP